MAAAGLIPPRTIIGFTEVELGAAPAHFACKSRGLGNRLIDGRAQAWFVQRTPGARDYSKQQGAERGWRVISWRKATQQLRVMPNRVGLAGQCHAASIENVGVARNPERQIEMLFDDHDCDLLSQLLQAIAPVSPLLFSVAACANLNSN